MVAPCRPVPFISPSTDLRSKQEIYTLVPTSHGSHFSDITVSTWSNLAWRSLEQTVAPRLPQRNFKWNSVLNMSKVSSSTFESPRTISAFLRNDGSIEANFLPASRWEKTVVNPKSAVDSLGVKQLVVIELLRELLIPGKTNKILSRLTLIIYVFKQQKYFYP